jgi:hypothetical protein
MLITISPLVEQFLMLNPEIKCNKHNIYGKVKGRDEVVPVLKNVTRNKNIPMA